MVKLGTCLNLEKLTTTMTVLSHSSFDCRQCACPCVCFYACFHHLSFLCVIYEDDWPKNYFKQYNLCTSSWPFQYWTSTRSVYLIKDNSSKNVQRIIQINFSYLSLVLVIFFIIMCMCFVTYLFKVVILNCATVDKLSECLIFFRKSWKSKQPKDSLSLIFFSIIVDEIIEK